MNLIQIQDRLKGMPTQAVMAYANGSNPEVPPYVALGELNRRKQMEQQAAQPPQGSVKDNVEQSLMARNGAHQGVLGVPHPSMQQAQEPVQMPQGAPTAQAPDMPTEDYADGGVVALPVRNEMFNYAQGGIIAFAGDEKKNDPKTGQRVSDEEEKSSTAGIFLRKIGDWIGEQQEKGRALEQGVRDKQAAAKEIRDVEPGLFEQLTPSERKAREDQLAVLQQLSNPQSNQVSAPTAPAVTQQTAPAPVAEAPDQASPAARPQYVPTGGIASNPAGNAAAQYLAQGFQRQPTAIPAYAPPQQEPLGKNWEQYLSKLAQQDEAAQEKFKQQEQQRAKSALWKNLIAAGEATRGGGGIGALLGGYGKSAIAEEDAALARESEQDKMMRERQFNNAKMNAELENLRRAEERGDAKAVYESKLKIRELENKDIELKTRSAEAIFNQDRADRRANASTAATHGLETQFINDWLSKKENKGKTVSDAIAALKTIGTGQRAESSYASLVEKYADNWAKMDPMERANMKKDGVNNVEDYVKRMLEITKQNKPGGGLPAGVTVTKVGG